MKFIALSFKHFSIVLVLMLCCCFVSCSTSQSIRGASLSNGIERTFNREMTVVLPSLRQALKEEQMTITFDSTFDEKTHIIISETPVSGFSWGEVIRVVAIKRGDDKTALRVLTERKMATNVFANGDYSTNIFFKVGQKLPK